MEDNKTTLTNEIKEVKFDSADLENLEEMEEVVTPGWGTVGCCTQ